MGDKSNSSEIFKDRTIWLIIYNGHSAKTTSR